MEGISNLVSHRELIYCYHHHLAHILFILFLLIINPILLLFHFEYLRFTIMLFSKEGRSIHLSARSL